MGDDRAAVTKTRSHITAPTMWATYQVMTVSMDIACPPRDTETCENADILMRVMTDDTLSHVERYQLIARAHMSTCGNLQCPPTCPNMHTGSAERDQEILDILTRFSWDSDMNATYFKLFDSSKRKRVDCPRERFERLQLVAAKMGWLKTFEWLINKFQAVSVFAYGHMAEIDSFVYRRYGPGKSQTLRNLGYRSQIPPHVFDMPNGFSSWSLGDTKYNLNELWFNGGEAMFSRAIKQTFGKMQTRNTKTIQEVRSAMHEIQNVLFDKKDGIQDGAYYALQDKFKYVYEQICK